MFSSQKTIYYCLNYDNGLKSLVLSPFHNYQNKMISKTTVISFFHLHIYHGFDDVQFDNFTHNIHDSVLNLLFI